MRRLTVAVSATRRRVTLAVPILLVLVAGPALAVTVLGPTDPSAQYFSASPPAPALGVASGQSSITTLTGPTANLNTPTGPVSKPNPMLTPGSTSITDLQTVCQQSKRVSTPTATHPVIPVSEQDAVYTEYHIAPDKTSRYGLDFLIPLQLGGATTINNVWPILKNGGGIGFSQKHLLNIRIHILVCHGELPLAAAQKGMATDWVALWARYGA